MTYKPKNPKAPWFRALNGDKPNHKKIRRIRPISRIQSRRLRTYTLQARLWKTGRPCACRGMRDASGRAICANRPHLCTEVHHRCGRVGDLLLATETWVALCAKAHSFVHANQAQARTLGLIGEGPWNERPRV